MIEGDDLADNAEKMGNRLRSGLEALQRRFTKIIGDVRGMGLMQGVELVVDEASGDRTPNPEVTARLFEETKARGLLIGRGGMHGNVLRIAPPLVVSSSDIDEALQILGNSFAAV